MTKTCHPTARHLVSAVGTQTISCYYKVQWDLGNINQCSNEVEKGTSESFPVSLEGQTRSNNRWWKNELQAAWKAGGSQPAGQQVSGCQQSWENTHRGKGKIKVQGAASGCGGQCWTRGLLTTWTLRAMRSPSSLGLRGLVLFLAVPVVRLVSYGLKGSLHLLWKITTTPGYS